MRSKIYLPDWIQTVAIVAALFLAVWELYLKSDAPKLEKAQNTVELLREGYDEKVLDSLNAFVAGPSHMYSTADGDFVSALVLLTPFHEYLVAFAVCYDTGLCLEQESLRFLCSRMESYEETIPMIYSQFGKTMPEERVLKQTKAWADCASMAIKA